MKALPLYFVASLLMIVSCKTTEDDTREKVPVIPAAIPPAIVSDTSSTPAFGIDISHYQGNEIDMLDTLKRDQLSFIICKATQGIAVTDPRYGHNWSRIPPKLLRGTYHFYSCADDPALQARHYLAVTDSLKGSDFPAIVDFEENSVAGGTPVQQATTSLLRFLGILENATGRVPMIYTDRNVGSRYLADTVFKRYPLWIAEYSNVPSPALPGAWRESKWILWQRSEKYSIDADTSDFDIFNGNAAALRRYLDAGVVHK